MYGRLLNPYSIERAVRAFTHGTGVRVYFDQDKGGYTDGKDIHIERLRLGMSEDSAMSIYGTVVHEMGHHLYSHFPVLKDKKERELRHSVWNLLEDARMEHLVAADAIGWHRVLEDSYSYDMGQVFNNPEVMRAGATPMRMFLAFDMQARALMYNTSKLVPKLNALVESFDAKEMGLYDSMLEMLERMHKEVMVVKDKRNGTLATWKLMDDMMKLFPEEDAESKKKSESGEGDGEESDGEGESKEGGDSDKFVPSKVKHKADDGERKHEGNESTPTGVELHDGSYKTTSMKDISIVDYSKGQRVGGSSYYTASPSFHAGGLANKVRKLLQIRSRSRTTYGQKKGKIDQRSLYRVGMSTAQSGNVFKNKMEATTTKDTAVHLLIDCSGSMADSRICHAMEAAGQMSNVLKNLGIPHAITGFTTDYGGRRETTSLRLFKQFNENPRDLGARLEDGSGKLQNNHDGEAVMYAESVISGRKEKHKVIIVFSDGEPCGPLMGCSEQLLDAVKCVEARRDMEIYGVGIECSSVKHYYNKHIVIKNSSELENSLLNLIEKVV